MLVDLPVIYTKQSETKITYILGSISLYHADLSNPNGVSQWIIIEEDFNDEGKYTGCCWLSSFNFRYLIPLEKSIIKDILFNKKESTVQPISDFYLK